MLNLFKTFIGNLKKQLFRADPLTRRMANAAWWSLCASALARLLMVAVWVICGRTLAKDEFGALTLIYSTINLLGTVGALGLGVTATRYLGELRYSDPVKAGRLMGLSYVLSVASGVIMSAALVLAARPLAVRVLGRADLVPSLQVGAVLVLFCALNAHQLGALNGLHAFRQIANLSFWNGLFAVAAVLVGVHYWGLLGAVYALAAWRLFVWLTHGWVLRREFKRNNIRVAFGQWKEERKFIWQFSLPALLTSLVFPPGMWLCSVWLMRTAGGASQMALFGAADRWHTVILFVPSALFGAVMPMLCATLGEGDHEGFRRVLHLNAAVCLLLAGLPAGLFALAAPMAMRVFGSSYVAGADVLRLLCLAAVAEVVNGVMGQVIALKSMWVRLALDVLLVSCLLLGSYVLIPRWHAFGLAAAYVFAFVMVAAGLLLYARRSGYAPARTAVMGNEVPSEA